METLHWDDHRIKHITKLRFVSDPGHPWWDWSYGRAITHDGKVVHIHQPDWKRSPLPKGSLVAVVLATAHRDGVYDRVKKYAISKFQ